MKSDRIKQKAQGNCNARKDIISQVVEGGAQSAAEGYLMGSDKIRANNKMFDKGKTAKHVSNVKTYKFK
jgi:hypothetical protein